MHIDEANLHNLTKLWHNYGSQPINLATLPLLKTNTHWPHRCWIDCRGQQKDDTGHLQSYVKDGRWLENIPESTIFPLWPTLSANNNMPANNVDTQIIEQLLLDKHWHCTFEQTAMYLALPADAKHIPQARPGFKVKPADTLEDIKVWADIGSEAFAYQIDLAVIQQLVNVEDIQILIAWQNDQAIASGLLYKTGDIIGVHQVGVKQAFQGKGFAKSFMLDIIAACEKWQGKYVVLQASQAGKPLYDSLGFKSQFLIKNFQRI
ncbi:GNAT family N-acetyltransferase [Colwelliaceae bacterium BS250]